ncbi:MAG: PAS domain S-box protein [Gammaproteobacteria bacterium]|nr:PAS domain S-box protein [Gammaproteobacteria bacterium]
MTGLINDPAFAFHRSSLRPAAQDDLSFSLQHCLHSALLHLAPVVVFRPDGEIVLWGRGAERTTGYKSEQALHATFAHLVKPHFRCRWAEVEEEIARSGEWCGEVTICHADGRYVDVVVHLVRFVDPDSGEALMLESHVDISAQKLAEASSYAAEQTLVQALRHGGAGTWTFDSERDEVRWDLTTQRLLERGDFPVSHGRIPLRLALTALHESCREAMDTGVADTLRDGRDRQMDLRLAGAGEERWISVTLRRPLHARGSAALVTGTVTDITDRVRIVRQLAASREDVRRYVHGLDAAIEDQRRHIARELHDELGQRLTALKIDLHWLTRTLEGGVGMNEATRARLRDMDSIIADTITEVRSLSAMLRPLELDHLGLVAALDAFLDKFQARTSLEVRRNLDKADQVGAEHRMAVFRIVQEALTNVARHSEASAVEVRASEVAGMLRIEVRDNGKGMPATAPPGHFGVTGMRERAEAIGGTLDIHSEGGTHVVLDLPGA